MSVFEHGCGYVCVCVTDFTQEPHTLLNLLAVPAAKAATTKFSLRALVGGKKQSGSRWDCLSSLAELLTRVEDLSHCLVCEYKRKRHFRIFWSWGLFAV
jgi:hypothetical protein